MKILVIGAGGREHALAVKLASSEFCKALFIAPGNGGTSDVAKYVNLDVTRRRQVVRFCHEECIDLAVIGPEAPLADGLADALRSGGTAVFGPGKDGALLEGSKAFMKEVANAAGVPTAEYACYTDPEAAKSAIEQASTFPLVVKADGLAAGKGVIIAQDKAQALDAISAIMEEKRFGKDAGRQLIIEEYLEGEELSFFALLSDNACVPFGAAQDHKRIGEGDAGPNTGGMGTFTPPPSYDVELKSRLMKEMIVPVQQELKKRNISYRGVLFAGIMLTKDGPKLLEFNVRFGDPETQVLMHVCESDIVPLFYRTAVGNLRETDAPVFSDTHAVCVVGAAKGYPGHVRKHTEITLPETLPDHTAIYHAGTKRARNGTLLATGGRVLNVVATADSLSSARTSAYAAAEKIIWDDLYYRRDIGAKAAGDALPDPLAPIPEPAEIVEESQQDASDKDNQQRSSSRRSSSRRRNGKKQGNDHTNTDHASTADDASDNNDHKSADTSSDSDTKDDTQAPQSSKKSETGKDQTAESSQGDENNNTDEKPKRGRRKTSSAQSAAPASSRRRRKPVQEEVAGNISSHDSDKPDETPASNDSDDQQRAS